MIKKSIIFIIISYVSIQASSQTSTRATTPVAITAEESQPASLVTTPLAHFNGTFPSHTTRTFTNGRRVIVGATSTPGTFLRFNQATGEVFHGIPERSQAPRTTLNTLLSDDRSDDRRRFYNARIQAPNHRAHSPIPIDPRHVQPEEELNIDETRPASPISPIDQENMGRFPMPRRMVVTTTDNEYEILGAIPRAFATVDLRTGTIVDGAARRAQAPRTTLHDLDNGTPRQALHDRDRNLPYRDTGTPIPFTPLRRNDADGQTDDIADYMQGRTTPVDQTARRN